MTNPVKILAFAGSSRESSYHKRLVKIAAMGAKATGAEVTYIDLRDYPMPIYDEDIHRASGMPENACKFQDLLIEHQGLLIASPEYNSSVSALLKNAIDWASRARGDIKMVGVFQNKVAAIMSTSPGALGGLRGLVHLRSILGNIGVLVLPEQKSIPNAAQLFNEDGSLNDPKQQQDVENLGAKLAQVIAKLNA